MNLKTGCAVFAACFCALLSSRAQDIMSSEQPESIALPTDVDAKPSPTPSLFTPVTPGMRRPTGAATPKSPVFLPPDIPAPAIQATPTTTDVVPSDAALLAQPTPPPFQAATPVSKRPTPSRPATVVTSEPQKPAVSQAQISAWVTQATEKQDANMAMKAGWAYFNRGEFSSAGMWFNQALEWSPGMGEAAYGLAFSKFREGDLSSAEAIVNFRGDSYPKMRVLKGDIASRRAVEAYEAKNYPRSRDLMMTASQARPLSRNEQTVLAWDYYYTKDYAKASELFEKLYRSSPSENTAQGLYASLAKTGNYEKADTIGDTVKGPLKKMYGTSEAKRYFKADLFVAAAGAGGEKIYRVLENYTSPSLALGFLYSAKSGTEGEGKLNMGVLPVISGRIYPSNKTMLTAQISHITLKSGDLADFSVVGQYPEPVTTTVNGVTTTAVPATKYKFTPTTSLNNLWDFSVHFEYQDWVTWYVTFGITPSGGPLNSKPVGNIGMIYRDEKGYVKAELYSKAVKESILSYVGMTDPYSGKDWGGVTESGGQLSLFRSIAPKWTIFLNGSYGYLDGTNVKTNTHLSGTAALAYEFEAKNFEYITVGVAASYETYDNNQNHFTYGNGGYFSPEYLAQALLQGQFLTSEGKKWIAAGTLGLGVQSNTQAASPYFPLDPDGRNYSSQDSSTVIGLIAAQGAYMISPNWLIGGQLGYAVTADYNEGSIGLYVRYFFEPRNGLLRTDLGLDRP
ncbi:MAG: cellulose synthase subunit BcsC-related outer membrane protein [Terrimicrobiaceae bacterium]